MFGIPRKTAGEVCLTLLRQVTPRLTEKRRERLWGEMTGKPLQEDGLARHSLRLGGIASPGLRLIKQIPKRLISWSTSHFLRCIHESVDSIVGWSAPESRQPIRLTALLTQQTSAWVIRKEARNPHRPLPYELAGCHEGVTRQRLGYDSSPLMQLTQSTPQLSARWTRFWCCRWTKRIWKLPAQQNVESSQAEEG